ncbi:hypothetical protein BDK61_0819 [Haloarcula quadrata]|uniref:Uncharacterized protein n=1 Tax=Haloarcula quadrata TaxID=182779 RepID=A0A495R2N2_9EURY|nr:hypothetical protein BDK61_0819 [Haloarcula quadrata]
MNRLTNAPFAVGRFIRLYVPRPFQSFPCYGMDCMDLTAVSGVFEGLGFPRVVVYTELDARSPKVFEYLKDAKAEFPVILLGLSCSLAQGFYALGVFLVDYEFKLRAGFHLELVGHVVEACQ